MARRGKDGAVGEGRAGRGKKGTEKWTDKPNARCPKPQMQGKIFKSNAVCHAIARPLRAPLSRRLTNFCRGRGRHVHKHLGNQRTCPTSAAWAVNEGDYYLPMTRNWQPNALRRAGSPTPTAPQIVLLRWPPTWPPPSRHPTTGRMRAAH